MKKVIGGAYLLKKDYLHNSRKELYRGDAVILKRYLPLLNTAIVEFDGMKFSIDPSYLEFIEGDAPIDSEDEPSKPAHYDTSIDTIQRYTSKGTPVEDLKKSRHYIDMLIEELEGRA